MEYFAGLDVSMEETHVTCDLPWLFLLTVNMKAPFC
jgi:hypothetical protein